MSDTAPGADAVATDVEIAAGRFDALGSRLYAVAAVGNAAVLTLLVLIASNAGLLLGHSETEARNAGASRFAPTNDTVGKRVVFIVIDGLRADTATDPSVMPFLRRLAADGGTGIANVECLVPSSVAAIDTFVTGKVPAPASFMTDFLAPAAPAGGIFAAIDLGGGSSFVAGPSLWTDKYGRWISAAETDATFGSLDEDLLKAAKSRVEADDHSFVVLHLGRVDRAAHMFGTASEEYRTAARWCDDAVRRLVEASPRFSSVLVTSDHGNTDGGGHAGFEREVVRTPLVMHGPLLPRGDIGTVSQSDVHLFLGTALALTKRARRSASVDASPNVGTLGVAVFGLAVAACLSIASSAWSGSGHVARQAFVLNATVWIAITLLVSGLSTAAAGVSVGALVAVALKLRPQLSRWILVAFAIGVSVGSLRVLDALTVTTFGSRHDDYVPWVLAAVIVMPSAFVVIIAAARRRMRDMTLVSVIALVGSPVAFLLGGIALTAIFAAAVLSGFACGRLLQARAQPIFVGMVAVIVAVSLNRVLGETVSLSTVDVRTAFRLVDQPLGVALALVAVVASQSLPALGVLAGLMPALVRRSADEIGAFTAGLATCHVGQSVVSGLIFAYSSQLQAMSLALGLLLRALAESLYFLMGLAALLFLAAQPVMQRLTVSRVSDATETVAPSPPT